MGSVASLGRCFRATSRIIRSALLAFIPLMLCCSAIPASAAWTGYFPGSIPFAIVAAGSTQVWALDQNGGVYQYNSSTNAFDWIKGNMFQIAVGSGDTVWVTDLSGEVYQYNFTTKTFQKVSGTLTTIAAGGQGIWGVNSTKYPGSVYVWNSVTKSFQAPMHGGPPTARSIYVGSYEIGVWVLDWSGNAWLYNTDTDHFDETNGVLTQIAVGNNQVWGVASDLSAWQYDVTTEGWIQPDPAAQLVQIAAGSNSNIWGVDVAENVYLFDQTTQKFVNQNAKGTDGAVLYLQQISISSGSAGVWAVDGAGTIWKQ
jgi:Tectonin domain